MQVRVAALEDFESLCRLWAVVDHLHARLLPGYFRPPPEPPRSRASLRRRLADPDQLILVAEQGSDLVGLAEVQLVDTPSRPELQPRRRLYLDDLVVEQSWRRRGVGRALLTEVSAWGRQRGAQEILLTVWAGNLEAEAFYDQLGFGPLNRVLARPL